MVSPDLVIDADEQPQLLATLEQQLRDDDADTADTVQALLRIGGSHDCVAALEEAQASIDEFEFSLALRQLSAIKGHCQPIGVQSENAGQACASPRTSP